MEKNVLVLIHGMIPNREPASQNPTYDAFLERLYDHEPRLRSLPHVGVEWGHELPTDRAPVRDDHKLTRAEQFVADRVGRARDTSRPGDHLIVDPGIPGMHLLASKLRENIVLFGLSDVVYYCSAEGETRVRCHVYEQVLNALAPYEHERAVRVHLFAHSLGVAIAHDFLFGLFNRDPSYAPGFVKDRQGTERGRAKFLLWREKAQLHELRLGGFASAASQLPLLVTRSQALVDRLYDAKQAENAHAVPKGIDAADIGIEDGDKTQWKNFYDVDDVLGFPSHGLYTLPDGNTHPAIVDVQVRSGLTPLGGHVGYWHNEVVARETAALFSEWAT